MVKEYITEHNKQFSCYKFTFRSGNEVILSENDLEELEQHIFEEKYQTTLDYKENKIMDLEYEIEKYEVMAESLAELVSIGNKLRGK